MRDPVPLPVDRVIAGLSGFDTIIDARSPLEHAEDHLPGAISVPVLDDRERERVGLANATHGAFEAKRLGAPLVARNIADAIERRFADHDRHWRPLVYCWRGGNRSNAFATVLARIGWHTAVLEGGYRAFRRHVIDALAQRPGTLRFVVVGGRTGCAKSRLLGRLAAFGEQVLDLEALASHRGSVLGALPGATQPSQKRFESIIWDRLRTFDASRPVFVESESRKVGRCQVPEALITAMRASPVCVIDADTSVRGRLLLEEYGHFRSDAPALLELLECLVPLHGSARVGDWKALAEAGRWPELVERLLLEHYDPSYDRSMRRNFGQIAHAPRIQLSGADPDAIDVAARALRDLSGRP